ASVVATKGVSLNIRVQDAKGLLRANPAMDDVSIGTYHRTLPFIPGVVSGTDPTGKSISVIVPRGQAAKISISSVSFVLADEKGSSLAGTEIQIPASVVASPGTGPAFTVQVSNAKDKP